MIDLFNIDVDKIKYNEEEIALIKLNGTIIYKPSKFYVEYNVINSINEPMDNDEPLKNNGLPYLYLRDNSQGNDKFTKTRIKKRDNTVTTDTTTPCNQISIVRLWYPETTSSIDFVDQSAVYNIWYIDTSNITNMNSMFYNCNNLISLSANNFDTNNVTSMRQMFYNCESLTKIPYISNWDTEKVTDMSYMFYNCNKLTSLDLSNFVTSNVTNMTAMFYNCESLESIGNVSNWDTSIVTSMSHMFYNANFMYDSLDVSNWNTSNVTTMSHMFDDCRLYYNPLIISNWNTGKVTDMSYMFHNCNIIDNYPKCLNLSNWSISNVTNMSYMFSKCSLEWLYLSGWDINEGTIIDNMLTDCTSLHRLYLDGCSNDTISKIISSEGFPIGDYYNGQKKYIYCERQEFIGLIPPIGWKFRHPYDGEYEQYIITGQFANDTEMIEAYIIITNVWTDLSGLFSGCTNLEYVDTYEWDTSNVTNMIGMFANCESLIELDASFSVGKVTNTRTMFYNCHSLTRLDLSNWDMSKVTIYDSMFYGCSSLHTLYLDNCSNDTISKIISVLPTEAIDGVTRTIYCKEANAEGLTAPTNWVFSYID